MDGQGPRRPKRFGGVGSIWKLLVLAGLLSAPPAVASSTTFDFKGEPIHPACVLALVDSGPGAKLPITVAISLAGCMAGPGSGITVSRDGEDLWIEDATLLGEGGRFGYRALSRLENGIFAVAMRRVGANGKAEVSLAAMDLVERPMIRSGMVIQVPMLELLGIVPLPDTPSKSFRRVGNVVHYKAGGGPRTLDRTVDLTELGKARKKR
jgi:hypothetical protein